MEEDKIGVKGTKEQAIELFATNPGIEVQEVADILGVHRKTVGAWRKDPNFHQQVLTRFNIELEGRLGNILLSLEN